MEVIRFGYILSYNLQFFADGIVEKTEEATAKKLDDARKEGQVARYRADDISESYGTIPFLLNTLKFAMWETVF